jgi:3-hydroxy acid dehydrogenase / malonic semialdehyde reductase
MPMNDQDWARGRVAFITGATAGFGEALARRVVAGGGRVIATGRRAERLEALVAELGEAVLARTMDIRSADSIAAAAADLPEPFAAIDVLFNNAGLALGLGKAHQTEPADWDQMIETNVLGLTRVTRAILPGMVERNRGDVVNVSSVAASYPYPGGNVYGATKAFVRQFSLNLRADLLGTKVRVTSLEPGMCETEFSIVRFKGDEAAAGKVYEGVHALSADEIAMLVEQVLRLPAHININTMEVMPVQQAWSPFAVSRD